MQKTANLLLLMILFLFLTIQPNFDSISMANDNHSKKELVAKYESNLRRLESERLHAIAYRRARIEMTMYDSLIHKSSVKWLLTGFIATQVKIESAGDQNAVSPEGAIGKAQFLPSTWKALIRNKLIPSWFDIRNGRHQDIAQLIYLDHLYSIFWNYPCQDRKALAAASYNAGPGTILYIVNKYGNEWRNHLPKETIQYLFTLKAYV